MGLPGRTSLARILLLAAVVSSLPPAVRAAEPVPPRPSPAAAPATAAGQPGRRDTFVPGRVLVGFEAGAGQRGRRAVAAAVDGRMADGPGRTEVVELDADADVRAAAQRLAGRPGVAFAEPDWLRRVDACDRAVCWHLEPSPGAGVLAAHAGGATGAGRRVAVVDTGVAVPTGPDDLDLEDRVVERWRCDDKGCQPTAAAPASSHGTEVASVVAAADDRDGTTGVAPDATVASYRVDAANGAIPSSHIQSALLRIATDDQVDVVNLSLGGTEWSPGEQRAVEAVLAAGKVVVASAGNAGDRVPRYPAAFPGVISVGATERDGAPAWYSSFGKVDVVAPGSCIPVAAVAGFDQVTGRSSCGPVEGGLAYNSGTSFSTPIVAGLLALADSGSPLLARLALETSAGGGSGGSGGPPGWSPGRSGGSGGPPGTDAAKRLAHGLVDADRFLAAHRPGAPPALVLETSGPLGSGDGQLPHPATGFRAYAFQMADDGAGFEGEVDFTGAASGAGELAPVEGEPGVWLATLDSGPLDPGLHQQQASAILEGAPVGDSVPVLALQPDDQAPGVALFGSGDDAWRRVGTVGGGDLDDVYAVTLEAGDRLDVSVDGPADRPVTVRLFDPATKDVLGQLTRAVACGGGVLPGCGGDGLHHQAKAAGGYLLDVVASGAGGDPTPYRLTWSVQEASGLPVEVALPVCSPNGDGVRDRCAWTAGANRGVEPVSLVTRGDILVRRQDGAGPRTWDGLDETATAWPDGPYLLRVLYLTSGARPQLAVFGLDLDRQAPRIADPNAAPNPFQPQPADGDRDTTTFALTSSEPGRLKVVIYRPATTTVVRVLVTDPQAAGRQRVRWSGRTSAGEWLVGRFSYVLQAIDAAGNLAGTGRFTIRVQ